MPQINCLPDEKIVPIDSSQTLLDALLEADIPHTHVCGGQAYCSTCRVMILDGIRNCSFPTPAEKALAKKLQFPVHVRLACQTRLTGNVQIRRMVLDNDDLDLVDTQLTSGVSGKEKNLVILLAAIRGANNFDEVNFPYDVLYIMGRYFQRTRRIVVSQGGKIDNYMANWFMATFDPEETDRAPERALWAGVEMLKSIQDLNQLQKQLNYRPLQLSIGIHMGPVVMVPVDPNRPTLLTPLGDAVTQASRIESTNRTINSDLLVSEPVFQALPGNAIVGQTKRISLSADVETTVYEITGMQGEAPLPIVKAESQQSLGKRIFAFMQKFGLGKAKA